MFDGFDFKDTFEEEVDNEFFINNAIDKTADAIRNLNEKSFEGIEKSYQVVISKIPTDTEVALNRTIAMYEEFLDKLELGDVDKLLDKFRKAISDNDYDIDEFEMLELHLQDVYREFRFVGESFEDFKIRVNGYRQALVEANQALDDFYNTQSLLAQQNKQMAEYGFGDLFDVESIKNTFEEIKNSDFMNLNDMFKDMFNSNDKSVMGSLVDDVQNAMLELQMLYQEDGETNEAYLNRKIAAQKKYTEAVTKLQNEQAKNTRAATNAMGNMFGSTADLFKSMMDSQNKETEEGQRKREKFFKVYQGLQVAQTVISTLASVQQIMSDSTIPSYWVKAPLAAAQLASGIASVIAIKNQSIDGGGDGLSGMSQSAGVSNASVEPLLDTNRDIQSMTSLNVQQEQPRDTRVYILESDIQDSNERVNIRQNSTTF